MFFMAVSLNPPPPATNRRHDALTLDEFSELIIYLGKQLNTEVRDAVNLEGYSYPFASVPKARFKLGLDEKKMMSSAFLLKHR
jgi:hypothetical protein